MSVKSAVRLQLEAEYETAVANLAPYLDEDRRVAIGEHADHVVEARKLVEAASAARDALEFLATLSSEEKGPCSHPPHSNETIKETPSLAPV